MIPDIPLKLILLTFIISVLVGAFQLYGADREEQGRATTIVEYQSKINEMESEYLKKLSDKAKEVIEEKAKRKKAEKRLGDILRNPPVEVRIHEVINDTICTDFSGINRLFRQYAEVSGNIGSIHSQ